MTPQQWMLHGGRSLRQIATAIRLPDTISGASTQLLSRTRHRVWSTLTNTPVQARFPNFIVSNATSGTETGIGAAATLSGSIVVGGTNSANAISGGTLTNLTWNGASSVSVANLSNSPLHDPVNVTAAAGSYIWYQIAWECPSGIIYAAGGTGSEQLDSNNGEQFRFAASGLDLTQVQVKTAWTGGSTSSNLAYRPCAIVAPVTDNAYFLVGTSIGRAFHASARGAANGDSGITARSVGASRAYINVAQGSSSAAQFLVPSNSALRMELAQYCNRVITDHGVNDLNLAPFPSGATVAATLQSLAAMFPGKRVYPCTVLPYTTGAWTLADGSDQTLFNSNTFAARRSALNALIRAGLSGMQPCFDIAAACSLGGVGDDTKWYADGSANYMFQTFTPADGLHPGTQAETYLQAAGTITGI